MSKRFVDGLTVVAGITALVLAGWIGWERVAAGGGGPTRNMENRAVDRWEQLTANGRRLGPEDAAVTVVVFGDYQCPYCRKANAALAALTNSYPNDLAMVFRHFPLESHPDALLAARLAECGATLGRFPEAHRFLFSEEDLSRVTVAGFLEGVGIPEATGFRDCLSGTRPDERIRLDREAGLGIGITGVPSIILNGTLLGPTPDSAGLSAVVLHELTGLGVPSEHNDKRSRLGGQPE